jgi:hypothetical protein
MMATTAIWWPILTSRCVERHTERISASQLDHRQAGFRVREVRDVTDAVALVSRNWRDARARRRERLVPLEGVEAFEGVQRFLHAVHVLASERRLSRFMYVAGK